MKLKLVSILCMLGMARMIYAVPAAANRHPKASGICAYVGCDRPFGIFRQYLGSQRMSFRGWRKLKIRQPIEDN